MSKKVFSKKNLKSGIISELEKNLEKASSISFVEYQGLSTNILTDLRLKVRSQGGEFMVAKNTLIKRALGEDKVLPKMKGQNALVFSFADAVLPLKTLFDFAKKNTALQIKGIYIEGKLLEKEQTVVLSELPAKEVLLANLVRTLNGPLTGLLNAFSDSPRKFVFAVSAVAKKKEVSQ